MLRSILGLSKKKASAEEASARVLNELIRSCPSCAHPLNGHQYRLVAATTLNPDGLESFRELLSAIRSHDWQKVMAFQNWEGSQANAEVYGLKCSDGALSVIVISAPFALEEPYTLMHQERVDNVEAFEMLPGGDTWHAL
jgi:hypothetical protein